MIQNTNSIEQVPTPLANDNVSTFFVQNMGETLPNLFPIYWNSLNQVKQSHNNNELKLQLKKTRNALFCIKMEMILIIIVYNPTSRWS